MFAKQYQCPDCGGPDGYRSRPRTFSEKYILPLFLLRPVRCSDCYRRSIVSMFIDVPERDHTPPVRPQAAA